ncbi:hypothetical protein NK6_4845 [Bradyrhizobium diazoefficiens]|uniref:Uncharacterized protein n=1 Tax=Bradyrhizobium diazoefficiens TaxID=1355477 RepID=A0A0E3VUU3_9BRAD|nr:hypothetical protein NK6_4845 [Bradyrhizobium diazoefficiens]
MPRWQAAAWHRLDSSTSRVIKFVRFEAECWLRI